MFVVVLALIIFASTSTHSSPWAPPTSPASYHTACNEDELHRLIVTYMCCNGSAKDHERVAASEDVAYKAAYDAVDITNVAVNTAKKTVDKLNGVDCCNLAADVVEGSPPAQARNTLDELIQKWRLTVDKLERLNPKEGFAFYYSIEIQTKWVRSFLTIFMFVLVGVVTTSVHHLLLWVSSTQN
ncbi:hypothetical protein VPH35_075121 [Triticum aestivum]